MRALFRVIPGCEVRVAAALLGLATTATMSYAQQPANWTGAIRCDIQSTAPGYSHQESQTWTLTGAAPATQGSVTVYPATWSVSGQGSHDRTRNATRRVAQWTASVAGPNAPTNAPIGLTRHAVGGQFDVAKWHAQLTVGGGYTGTDQFINDGVPQSVNRLAATVYEWQFPKIEAAQTQTQLTGSHTTSTKAQVGPLQPDDANVTITCSWSLARGSAPPLPPLPPPAVSQPSSPISSGPATNPPTAAAPAPTAPPAIAAAPPVTTPSSPPPAVATATPAPVTPPASAAPPSASAPATAPPAAPPAATSTSVAPPAPPPPTSTSKIVDIEIYAHFPSDSTVPFTSWWPPNGKARYVVGVDNTPLSGSSADGTILRIPASAGLSKTGVACVAQGGAQCPAGLTIAQLENGVAIPRLPAFSYIRVAFDAQVTAALGSSVTVTATVTKPPNTRDTSSYDDTVTKTHAILTPSTDTNPNSPLAPVRANVPQPSTPATSSLPSIAQCVSAGPVIATPAVSHTGTSLSWPHINGATYTVSRDDVGLLTTSPLTSALFPSTVAFSHSAPMYYSQTYRYSVRADYGGGCGISTVTFVPPRPPSIWADARLRGAGLRIVDLLYEAWFANGGGGVRIFGSGMPADGLDAGCKLTLIGDYTWCDINEGVGPGDHTWLVVPYWQTENGIFIDASSGTRVTLTVQ
jgi:hypothetical protein